MSTHCLTKWKAAETKKSTVKLHIFPYLIIAERKPRALPDPPCVSGVVPSLLSFVLRKISNPSFLRIVRFFSLISLYLFRLQERPFWVSCPSFQFEVLFFFLLEVSHLSTQGRRLSSKFALGGKCRKATKERNKEGKQKKQRDELLKGEN